MSRVGVFVCRCGHNIARAVDVPKVTDFARRIPGVVFSEEYSYFCSAPGQDIVQEAIKEHDLTGVVVAACSPQLHEPTFHGVSSEAGLNPFLCEMANIREQCSWVHSDGAQATQKACHIVTSMVEKVKRNHPLHPIELPVTRGALVIGGGVAGIRAALDIANAGYPVTLVEREPSIGGNMSRLSETFPTLDCSQCILTPLMVQVSRHDNIELLTYSEVESVSGYVGNLKVRIKKKSRYVRSDLCTGCNDCVPVCPVTLPNAFDRNLTWRKAIYIPFPQAVPNLYTLDAENCINSNLESEAGDYRVLACERCYEACGPRAIDFDMPSEIVEREVGAIIVATGFDLMGQEQLSEYGYGKYPDVLDGLEFERLLSASGPTEGEVKRPSDGKVPKEVVFIQCAGSRDPQRGVSYCSRYCCMATAKHSLLYKHKVHDGNAYVFYIDIRTPGKGYEEFVSRVMEEERVLYLRGRVSEVRQEDGKLRVFGVDTISNQHVEVMADMVVLATAAMPPNGDLPKMLRIPTDEHGFLQEAHPKLRPVETLTAGVFLAGAAQFPKDIPDTVAQASAAASKVLEMLSRPVLHREPTVARVNEAICVGCFECVRVCPYGAVEQKEIKDREDNLVKMVAGVIEGLCEGCGACTAACRVRSIDVDGFNDEQVFAQLGAMAVARVPVEELA
jgi:heterodisulfide reductase subunit A